jgi:hypothetical protein
MAELNGDEAGVSDGRCGIVPIRGWAPGRCCS